MNKYFLFLLLNILAFSNVFAQKEENGLKHLVYLDSVTQSYYSLGNLDSLAYYNTIYKKDAIEANDSLHIGFSLSNEIVVCYNENRLSDIPLVINKLVDINKFTNYPIIKAKAYNLLCAFYSSGVLYDENIDSAIFYGKLQVRYSELAEDIEGMVSGSKLIALNYQELGKIDSAYYYYDKCLRLIKKIPVEKNSILFLLYLSSSNFHYVYMSDTTKAIELLNESLIFAKTFHDTTRAYVKMSSYSKDKKSSLYYSRYNYRESNRLDSPIYSYFYIEDLGETFLKYKVYDSAFYYLKEALGFASKNGIEESQTYKTKLILGEVQRIKGEYDKAIPWYKEALVYTEGKYNLSKIYKGLSQCYEQTESFENALKYYRKSQEVKDSIFSIEKLKTITEIEEKYEGEKKESKIKELSYQNTIALQNNKRQEQESRFYLIGGGILLLLIVAGGVTFIRIRNTHFQNKEYKLEQQLLRSQMNPHFMANFLMAVKLAIKKEETNKAIEYMDKFGVLSRQVLESSINDFVTLEEEVSFLNNYLSLQQLVAYSEFEYSVTVAKNIDESELQIPPMLIQPFVENAIEHGFLSKQDKGRLEVSFQIIDNYLIAKIKDNGKGFASLTQKVPSKHKSRAMDITKSRIELLKIKWNKNISFDIISSNSGAEVVFKTPIQVA